METAAAKSADGTPTTSGLREAAALLDAAMQLRLPAPGTALEDMQQPLSGSENGGASEAAGGAAGAAREAAQRAELLSLGLASWLPAVGQMLDSLDAATILGIAALMDQALAEEGRDHGMAVSLRDLVLRAVDGFSLDG
ncbi:hypothetical protein HXX76_011380 [Chlamydomonas incerta]|uniref:Uncharacterized protein n=1 Tax=Chlamydomonas incerta TaxID=51695 RepID=A0A835SY82_CHLIN|nr:hypothetical protein HXX76_011380 [Chlamydomonas incerta]|eukprot:KAG2428675.1 hypothetical protein HXX76_011380 [Chlamydomonas incerta]